MRGSVEPVAVARDVASSSPSKPPPALDMMRYQRISPDCLPLANGGGSRKPTPAAPRSSKDDDAPAVATDSSRLASYLAATSLGPKPRARAPQPSPPAPASSSMTRSPARDHSHHPPSSDFPDPTSPSSTGGGASGSAGHDATMLLQWGQNKRSRGRRDASAASTSASASTPSPQRRQAAVKIQRRSSEPAEKLMRPPSYRRGSNLRVISSLPAHSGAAGGDAHHFRNAHPHPRSVEERAGGQSSSAAPAGAGKQQRPGADKAEAGTMVTGTQESKHQHGGGGGHQAEHHGPGSSSKAAAVQKQLPRIYTTLSRKEKEDDFLAMKGTKLSQRPKKRPKAVEKAVNFVCPGTWLSDVTRSRYEVREKKCSKKQKRRGLKGMEMDSDSD